MTDYYLKFNTESEVWPALVSLGLAEQAPDTGIYFAKGIALDIIGTIYKPTGNTVTTPDGFTVPEMTAVDGFHANIRGTLSEEQQASLPLIDPPSTPYRVWA